MPESENSKVRPHPWKLWDPGGTGVPPVRAEGSATNTGGTPAPPPPFAELLTTSNYTFLTGASHPEELVEQAAALGYRAIALTDLHTVAGMVRAHVAAKEHKVRLVVGSRLRLLDLDGLTVAVYPTDMDAYRRMCRLLTLGKRRAAKGECTLTVDDLQDHAQGLLAVAAPDADPRAEVFEAGVRVLKAIFGDDLSIAARVSYGRDPAAALAEIGSISQRTDVPLVATNDVLYHDPARRPLQDVLTCIRHGCTIAQAGFRLEANAERHLKHPAEMQRLFAAYPDAVARTARLAERCDSSLDGLRYEYPTEVVPEGATPIEHLRVLTEAGIAEHYPGNVPAPVRAQIEYELALIDELRYAHYFLTVHDLVRFARSKGILCQGRGAAANSAVCYCLGVTSVDPAVVDLLFERFISRERNEPPDIDIDFEHERREEVIQYIYGKYGRDRAALTAEVITYRGRSAVRDVGKALGLSLDLVDRLAKEMEWWDKGGIAGEQMRRFGLDPADPTLQWLARLVGEILGFPRHLSQHVGGFVITRSPLSELVPIENAAMPDRTVIEWDKDDIDAVGMLKVDCLGLGMLTCLSKCFELVKKHHARELTLATVPWDDVPTYDMICRADTIGVFQIESRAQMSMLPRLRPRCWYDLVIEVAIVRPGPIQGDMVHPYLRRRCGEEPISYASPAVQRVLERTLGVPLFQEQCMALAVVAAGFTPGEADQLRRAMAAWKRKGDLIFRFGKKIIEGMVANGYERAFAERCFEQIKGFSEYGFPESHAASFALIVYASAWLKCHYPAAFACALLNSQPMGFYQPAQIVRDAVAHGVCVRPVDVNSSAWDCTLEGDPPALRLGMRMVKGLQEAEGQRIAAPVAAHGPVATPDRLRRLACVRVASLRALARADAFGSMGLSRQQALWALRGLTDEPLPLLDGLPEPACPVPALPPVPAEAAVNRDYGAVGLSLRAHPVSFIRDRLAAMGVTPNCELADPILSPHGRRVTVAGLVLVRQRPGTASGIVFITLEDEGAIANLIVRPRVYERYRRAARHGSVLVVKGTVERRGEVVHVMVTRLTAVDAGEAEVGQRSRDFH